MFINPYVLLGTFFIYTQYNSIYKPETKLLFAQAYLKG